MESIERFDFIIIGAGQAGPRLAQSLADAGMRVAIIERKFLGGSCVNYGCTPTKAALASARIVQQFRRAQEYGINAANFEVDFAAVIRRAQGISQCFRQGLEKRFLDQKNPRLIFGDAKVAGKRHTDFCVSVNGEMYRTQQIVINTGAKTDIPKLDGLETVPYITAENWLQQTELPQHIVFVGGGYIAVEMGQFYRRMGSEVTILERSPHLLKHEDSDVSEAIADALLAEGVRIKTGVTTSSVQKRGDEILIQTQADGGTQQISGSHLFVASGRRPNIADLGLESIGVNFDRSIVVDKRLATNMTGVWAAGDVRGGPMFTHTSWDDFRILESQILGDGTLTTDRVVPYAVFCDPELGRVGFSEREAKESGRKFKVSKFEMQNDSRSIEMGETRGFIKVIVDDRTDLIIGATVLASGGSELVHMYVDLMNAGAPFTVIRDAIHIHPTQAESIQAAVANIEPAAWDVGLRHAA